MKKYAAFVLVICLSSFSGSKDSESVLRDMYKRYAGKWHKTFTFTQTTEHYRNDSLRKTSTWYEYIIYPDKFRIDLGEKKEGNAMIYVRDSAFSFRKGKLNYKGYDNDNLTFMLGGLYFYPFDTVLARISKQGYDLKKFHEGKWNGHEVYVIGANDPSEKVNQLWVDKEKLVIERFIKFKGNNKEEGVFSGHKQFGGGWSETEVVFYVNDKLLQKEKYYDCRAGAEIDPRIFDPYLFITTE